MLSLTGYFTNMLKLIRPPKARRDLADTLPDDVRDHLAKCDQLKTAVDAPVTRLAGSFGRHTGQGDIHDVDILVFVDASYADQDPAVVLDDLAEALRDLEVDGYGTGEIKTARKNRRSHHVEFKKDGEAAFHIDVVPVVRPGDDPDAVLLIPDREWVAWDDTQPLGYGTRLVELNKANELKVKKTIKLMKRIRERHLRTSLKRPKSYWLESKVYELWRDGRLSKDASLADLMYQLLNAIRSDCGQTRLAIYDPCLGRDLTESWEQAEYDEFVEMLDKVIGYLEPIAYEADADTAVEAWRKVFGADVFRLDSDVEQETKKAAAALAAGATVARSGLVVPASSGVAGTTSPSHSFYGED